ncbi:MAG: serine/threonine protein kinase, partial [Lentisphaeria bacterium]|nr:serine/threonine protein kinase [Lentisphaeria bacterium]
MSSQPEMQSLLRPGDRLGKYVIDRCIGIGGMGEVYLVHHAHGQMSFALKLIKPAIMREDPVFCERFLREARLASRFQHPGSIEVNDAELDAGSGILYLVMEYVDGQTVDQILADGALPEIQALEIVRSVAETLDAASVFGLVHRDIKPANIMISRSGQVKLA